MPKNDAGADFGSNDRKEGHDDSLFSFGCDDSSHISHFDQDDAGNDDLEKVRLLRRQGNWQSSVNKTKTESGLTYKILSKSSSFGAYGLFNSAHIAICGKLLTDLAPKGPSASAIMSTYFVVVMGIGVGLVLAAGLDFAAARGKQEYKEAGDVVKTGNVLTVTLGVLSTAAMLATRGIFPLIFDSGTAKIASDFFTGYSGAPMPLLYIVMAPQFSSVEGDWYIPLISMFSMMLLSGIASYFLGASLGALGIGLGGAIGNLVVAAAIFAWTFRSNYKKYELFHPQILEFKDKMLSLLSKGWKLALQRLTEWGNLFAITTIVGIMDNDQLSALNPAIIYLVLFAAAEQGVAAAAGMIIKENRSAMEKVSVELQPEEKVDKRKELHKNSIKAIFLTNLLGVMVNSMITISFYFARKPLTSFFLTSDDQHILDSGEMLLWTAMLGLIPDALRIIGAGALRGWNDLMYPTNISFLFMTVIAIPVAVGLNFAKVGDLSKMMIYSRDVSILLSAIFILGRCYQKVKSDQKSTSVSLFSAKSINTDEQQQQSIIDFDEENAIIPNTIAHEL